METDELTYHHFICTASNNFLFLSTMKIVMYFSLYMLLKFLYSILLD